MANKKNNYKIFVDLDGVLCDYMNNVLRTMNAFTEKVTASKNIYKARWPKSYATAKKAIKQMGGDIDLGDTGPQIVYEDVGRGTDKKHVRNLMYTLISNDYKWWAGLSWMPGGKELWEYVSKYNPTICSGPMGPNSKKGKIAWCNRELNVGKDRVILTHTKHEEIMGAIKIGKTPVLIDDMLKYVVPWRNAGGIAIQHINLADTINQLNKLGL